MKPPQEHLVKVSVLAEISGVPAATIKHYVREGLLPEPTRTSRNMAYYDPALADRVRQIKSMQKDRFLPLKVIKQILDESDLSSETETVAATISRVLSQHSVQHTKSRATLLAEGHTAKDIDDLKALAFIEPMAPDTNDEQAQEDERYAGQDLELLELVLQARKSGLSEKILPLTLIRDYAQSIRKLISTELLLFERGVIPNASEKDLPMLTEAATTLSERLVILLRRKLLLPTFEAVNALLENDDAASSQ